MMQSFVIVMKVLSIPVHDMMITPFKWYLCIRSAKPQCLLWKEWPTWHMSVHLCWAVHWTDLRLHVLCHQNACHWCLCSGGKRWDCQDWWNTNFKVLCVLISIHGTYNMPCCNGMMFSIQILLWCDALPFRVSVKPYLYLIGTRC